MGTYSIGASDSTPDEDIGSVTFSVYRSDATYAEFVYVSTIPGTASNGDGDYSYLVNHQLFFSSGEHFSNFSLSINDDDEPEDDESFTVIAQQTTAGAIVASKEITIVDDDVAPVPTTYSLSASTNSTLEGDKTITFTLDRGGDLPSKTLYFSTYSLSAASTFLGADKDGDGLIDDDYVGVPDQAINFSNGEDSETFTVTLKEDGYVEDDEQFEVLVTDGVYQGRNASNVLETETITIRNDDNAPVPTTYSLSASTNSTLEGDKTITFTLGPWRRPALQDTLFQYLLIVGSFNVSRGRQGRRRVDR